MSRSLRIIDLWTTHCCSSLNIIQTTLLKTQINSRSSAPSKRIKIWRKFRKTNSQRLLLTIKLTISWPRWVVWKRMKSNKSERIQVKKRSVNTSIKTWSKSFLTINTIRSSKVLKSHWTRMEKITKGSSRAMKPNWMPSWAPMVCTSTTSESLTTCKNSSGTSRLKTKSRPILQTASISLLFIQNGIVNASSSSCKKRSSSTRTTKICKSKDSSSLRTEQNEASYSQVS